MRSPELPHHASCWQIAALLRDEAPERRARVASDRLLQLAAGMPDGSWLSVELSGDGTGHVDVRLHSNTRLDPVGWLGWVGEDVARWTPVPCDGVLSDPHDMRCLVEVVPAVQVQIPAGLDLDDALAPSSDEAETAARLWPVGFIDDGMELLNALTTVDAQIRVHMSPATDLERQMLARFLRSSVQSRDPLTYTQYMGDPVRVRCLVGESGDQLSPRLRAALGRLGVGLQIVRRSVRDTDDMSAWTGDRVALSGAVQPFGVAQCLVRLPACGEQAELCGVPTTDAETKPVPLDGVPVNKGLRLGSATASDGRRNDVRLGVPDLLLHTQVLGVPGTGKSTLLAGLVAQAREAGIGVSVLDPHGHLVDRILREGDESMIGRTTVVRSGDHENAVPVNALASLDFDMISQVMLQVLRELLDPNNQGFLGPRFERAFSQTLRAQRVLFGSRANLGALPLMLRDKEHVSALRRAVATADPDLAIELENDFVRLSNDDFGEVVAWINAKYQRLIATPELRAALLTGEDAIDVTEVVDHRETLLVDLASPSIGLLGAQFLGEMWLAKHWAALSQRRDVTQPHLLIVDEAHLFASGLLPRLLSEARKFGFGVVLAHQHLEQLTPHLRESALASTSNVIVFRSGPREAATSGLRLGDWAGGPLTRLRRFNAAATLSQGDEQTSAFTLVVDHNDRVGALTPGIGERIEVASMADHVEPFRQSARIDGAMVDARVRELGATSDAPLSSSGSPFLDEWLAKRSAGRRGGPARAVVDDDGDPDDFVNTIVDDEQRDA